MQTMLGRDGVRTPRVPTLDPPPIGEVSAARNSLTMAHVVIVLAAGGVRGHLQDDLDRLAHTMVGAAGAVLLDVDGCTDATVEAAQFWAAPRTSVTVVQPGNFGHGGNQKFCMRWALERGYSIVVLLDAAGSCAVEPLTPLLAPLLHGDADAVLGVRTSSMARPSRKPGIVDERVRTSLGRRLGGARPIAITGGARAYNLHRLDIGAVEALTDGPGFDTELVRHLLARGRRVLRIERPNN